MTATRTPPTLLPASVPSAVRDAWAVLDHGQRAALLDLLARLDPDDAAARDRLLGQLGDYARRATAPAAPAPAADPVSTAPAPEPGGSTLAARAEVARLGTARWIVTCRDCGAERPARAPSAGRLPSGLCDRCAERRESNRAKRRAARQREAE